MREGVGMGFGGTVLFVTFAIVVEGGCLLYGMRKRRIVEHTFEL